jgi:hypothetical protein
MINLQHSYLKPFACKLVKIKSCSSYNNFSHKLLPEPLKYCDGEEVLGIHFFHTDLTRYLRETSHCIEIY